MIQVEGVYGGGSKINGVKNEYLATANIAKGDFVQLTTKGVEEVALTKIGEATISPKLYGTVSAVVLSSTQILVAYAYDPGDLNTYTASFSARVYTYNPTNNEWDAGTLLRLHSETANNAKYDRTVVGRLTDNRAVIAYAWYNASSKGKTFVVDISEDGEMTVLAEGDETLTTSEDYANYNKKIVTLTPESFVILFKSSYYLRIIPCTFIDNVLKIGTTLSLGSSNLPFTFRDACKLNETTILITGSTSSSSLFRILSVSGTTGNVTTTADVTALAGKCVEWEENKVIEVPSAVNGTPRYLTYDSINGTLVAGENVGAVSGYNTFEAVRISDDKICTLESESSAPNESDEALYLGIIDTNNNTRISKLSGISPVGRPSGSGIGFATQTCSGFGWFVAISEAKEILVAPTITTITAEPVDYRIDGVASKGATASQMAEVITP